jgi:hypothetical protein
MRLGQLFAAFLLSFGLFSASAADIAIVTQPASRTVNPGQQAAFTVVATALSMGDVDR